MMREFGKTIGLTESRPNILLSSAGRRTYLAKYFVEALGGEGKVFATNSGELCPVAEFVDGFSVSPLIYSDEYIPFLIDYCEKHSIGAIVPLFDIDIPVLSQHREELIESGCFPVVSSFDFVRSCNDKYLMAKMLESKGLSCAKTFIAFEECKKALEMGSVSFPLMVKPRWGMGSIGVFKVHCERELVCAYEMVQSAVSRSYLKYESEEDPDHCVMVQQCLEGQEYGIDAMFDMDGRLRGVSQRKKLAMRSGETDVAETLHPAQWVWEIAHALGEEGGLRGNVDADVIEVGEAHFIIDINARFGGGYPFSHVSGVNLPKAIVQWLRGDSSFCENLSVSVEQTIQKDFSMLPLSRCGKKVL